MINLSHENKIIEIMHLHREQKTIAELIVTDSSYWLQYYDSN